MAARTQTSFCPTIPLTDLEIALQAVLRVSRRRMPIIVWVDAIDHPEALQRIQSLKERLAPFEIVADLNLWLRQKYPHHGEQSPGRAIKLIEAIIINTPINAEEFNTPHVFVATRESNGFYFDGRHVRRPVEEQILNRCIHLNL